MSNIQFLTTKKHIKSYNIFQFLNKINQDKFGGLLSITESSSSSWGVVYQNEYILDLYEHSTRKLSAKHPHYQWQSYISRVIFNELGVLTQGMLSDESDVKDHWKPIKNKWTSYADFLKKMHNPTSQNI